MVSAAPPAIPCFSALLRDRMCPSLENICQKGCDLHVQEGEDSQDATQMRIQKLHASEDCTHAPLCPLWRRVLPLVGGFVVNMILGVVPYASSYMRFKGATDTRHSDLGWVFTAGLASVCCAMAYGDKVQRVVGVSRCAALGCLLMSVSFFLAAATCHSLCLFTLTCGVGTGLALGLASACPLTAAYLAWPEHRGVAAAIVLSGLSASPLLFSALEEEALDAKDQQLSSRDSRADQWSPSAVSLAAPGSSGRIAGEQWREDAAAERRQHLSLFGIWMVYVLLGLSVHFISIFWESVALAFHATPNPTSSDPEAAALAEAQKQQQQQMISPQLSGLPQEEAVAAVGASGSSAGLGGSVIGVASLVGRIGWGVLTDVCGAATAVRTMCFSLVVLLGCCAAALHSDLCFLRAWLLLLNVCVGGISVTLPLVSLRCYCRGLEPRKLQLALHPSVHVKAS
ncbi:hypothetical protein Emag_005393 [Eimeria magna]